MTAGRNTNTLSTDWGTPDKYVISVKRFFGGEIDLDPCSNEFSIVRAKVEYKQPGNDGLVDGWDYENIYVNPPYGRNGKTSIKTWLNRCVEQSKKGSNVLALIPVATNTSHWKNCVFNNASYVCFLYDTRLKFLINGVESKKGAPMACSIVYWGNKSFYDFNLAFAHHGATVDLLYSRKAQNNGSQHKQ